MVETRTTDPSVLKTTLAPVVISENPTVESTAVSNPTLEIETPKRLWSHLLVGEAEVQACDEFIFSGGACNYIDSMGKETRNTGRDTINDLLEAEGINFFDPQIDKETHGRGYEYSIDGKSENLARVKSTVDLYELNPFSFGAVTQIEIIDDIRHNEGEQVIYLNRQQEKFFTPLGMDNPDAQAKHFGQYVKAADIFKTYFKGFAEKQGKDVIHIFESEDEYNNFQVQEGVTIYRISQDKMHAVDLLQAYDKATRGEKVAVYFDGWEGRPNSEKAPPTNFGVWSEMSEEKRHEMMSRYIEEGNAMRKAFMQIIEKSKSSYIVDSVIDAKEKLIELWNKKKNEKIAAISTLSDIATTQESTKMEFPQRRVEISADKSLLVTLEDNTKGEKIDSAVLERMLQSGPVSKWIDNLRNPKTNTFSREGFQDILPGQTVPDIIPKQFRIIAAREWGGTTQIATGLFIYERITKGKDGIETRKQEERMVFIRADASCVLPILTDESTKKRYMMLSDQFRDGVGSKLSGEAPAGTADKGNEGAIDLMKRELKEESALTGDELASAHITQAFDKLAVSPGGTTEMIDGYILELSLPSSRFQEITNHLGGVDEGEIVQHGIYELPTLLNDTELNAEHITKFLSDWDNVLNVFGQNDQDMKTLVLLQEMRDRDKTSVLLRLITASTSGLQSP